MSNRKVKKGAFSDGKLKSIAQENRDIGKISKDCYSILNDSIDGFIRKLVKLSEIEADKVNSNSLSYSLLEETIKNNSILKPLFEARDNPQKRTIDIETKVDVKKPKYIIEPSQNMQNISERDMKTPDILLKSNLIPDYRDQWNFGISDDYSL